MRSRRQLIGVKDWAPTARRGTSDLLMIAVISFLAQEVVSMPDVLIRDLPERVIVAIDANAKRLGLSRNEYLRRTLAFEARPRATVTVADLRRSAGVFADLGDPDVMSGAWS